MKNVAVTAEAAMKVSSDTLTAEVENLKTSLASTSQEFKAVQKQASDVENDVINNVSHPPVRTFALCTPQDLCEEPLPFSTLSGIPMCRVVLPN